jgi:glycosyltransferase involved in cell wall biosynthesis
LKSKDDYRLHSPVKVISVGRQFAEKNPDNLIRAIASFENVHLTLVGDGQLHEYLKNVVNECRIDDRVEFHAAMPNDELCRILPEYDIFAVHTEYWEISKSVLEPLLTGLPVVINRRKGSPVPELTEDICMLVDNTVESYRDALVKLMTDHELREKLGRCAYRHAQENWAPAITEARFAQIYQQYMRQDEHDAS